MASGHVNRINRPNTWLLRPDAQRAKSSCQHGAVHTWHIPTRSLATVTYPTPTADIFLNVVHSLRNAPFVKSGSSPCRLGAILTTLGLIETGAAFACSSRSSLLRFVERRHEKCITRPIGREGVDLERVARDAALELCAPGSTYADPHVVLHLGPHDKVGLSLLRLCRLRSCLLENGHSATSLSPITTDGARRVNFRPQRAPSTMMRLLIE